MFNYCKSLLVAPSILAVAFISACSSTSTDTILADDHPHAEVSAKATFEKTEEAGDSLDPHEIRETALRFVRNFSEDYADSISLLHDNVQYCAAGASIDYPFLGCYDGKESAVNVLNAGGGIYEDASITTRDIAVSGSTAYMDIAETLRFVPTKRTMHLDVFFTLKFKKVNGQLKIKSVNFMYRDANLPAIDLSEGAAVNTGGTTPPPGSADQILAATKSLFNDVDVSNLPSFFERMADDIVYCVGNGADYPMFGCYQNKETVIKVLSARGGLVAKEPLKLLGIASNDTTGYLAVEEKPTWVPTQRTIKLNSIWAIKYKVVDGQLKIARVDYMHQPADIPTVKVTE